MLLVTAIAVAAIIARGQLDRGAHLACLDFGDSISVCAASDMAKPHEQQVVSLEHPMFDLSSGEGLSLSAARNEVVAFQLLLHSYDSSSDLEAGIDIADFVPAGASSVPVAELAASTASTTSATPHVSLFQAWYHPVFRGGYTFGADSEVLPWPANYPDVLVPQQPTCGSDKKPVFETVRVNPQAGSNTAVWVDIYIPNDMPAGRYQSRVQLSLSSGETLTFPLALQVWPASLPDKPTVDAIGELYRSYGLEGATKDKNSDSWREMAHCYQRLAHQHRIVLMERWDDMQDFRWDTHRKYAAPILDGSLFSPASGYVGPGANTPVQIWRTPWEQDFDRHLVKPMSETELGEFETMARSWKEEVNRQGWKQTHYFAYLFDEIDGPTDETGASDESEEYLQAAHKSMYDVQQALDKGTDGPMIDLIWTSHSDPRFWDGKPGLDLAGTVRLWAPNASAAPSEYLKQRKQLGERIWFYHDGHPTVGAHSINVSGIEMRSWGVIGARYNFDGQFMWAANLGQDSAPFRDPTYRTDDDRFGNGVIVYPGNQLPLIGYPARPGPMPSMRMKAWRRGLQDAELVTLAKNNGHAETVNRLLEELVPVALADALDAGVKRAQWSQNPADWIEFRDKLLPLASPPLR